MTKPATSFSFHDPHFVTVSPCRFANTLEIVSLIREMADIKKSRRVSESVKLTAVANLEV